MVSRPGAGLTKTKTGYAGSCFGGQSRCGLEPQPALMDALRGELFPDVWKETAEPAEFNIVRRARRRHITRRSRNDLGLWC